MQSLDTKKKIHLLGLNKPWSPGWDFFYLDKILTNSGFSTSSSKFAFNSNVYLHDKFSLRKSFYHLLNNNVYFDYFHGNPSISREFENIFNFIVKSQKKYTKIRVTNDRIYEIFVKHGLQNKIKKIYLGVDNEIFNEVTNTEKSILKNKLNIPEDYIVIGSFQKDGIGWNEGLEPKLIKGPDIFIETIKLINKTNLKIFVLLLGPARGFVKKELLKLNVKFINFYENDYFNLKKYYNILDFYLICSREEGGPKALLESMACKVPVISTPVGQAVELIKNKENGIVVKNFSPNLLAENSIELIENEPLQKKIKFNAKQTALENDHLKQKLLWKDFFSD